MSLSRRYSPFAAICCARLKNGEPCGNLAKKTIEGRGYCGRHLPKVDLTLWPKKSTPAREEEG